MEPSGRAQEAEGSLFARIALAIGATLVFLVLLELGGRVFELTSPPGPAAESRGRLKRIDVPDPVPGAYRIFLYGGSTVAGAPTLELSFVAQLEFWLARLAPERPVQIVNFGVNGRPSGYVLQEAGRTFPHDPDLAIVLTAHNDFQRWKPEGDWERLRWEIGERLESTAVARTFRRVGRRLKAAGLRGPIELRRPAWIDPMDRQSERFLERAAGYEQNTRAVVALAQEHGVPLIFATASSNLADWPPVHHFVHDESYMPRMHDLEARIAAGEVASAAAEIASLGERYPNDAMLTYLLGRIAAAQGDTSEASVLFDAARDADPIPWRVLSRFNEHVRRISQADGVFLADVDLAFRRAAEQGLVGFRLMADNCHPTPLGGAVLARELLATMAREKLLLDDLEGLPPLDELWQAFRSSVDDPALWLEYLHTNAVYVMKWPFYDFAAAAAYLEEARVIAPDDWRIPANLGTMAVLDGRVEEGRARLERAAQLFGGPLRDDDRGPTPYLREAMAILSGELPAFVPAPVE